MPGVWEEDDFVEGGLASIEEFTGRLTDVEEDVEGKYGLQKELHYGDVEIIKAADDVTLENGRYTTWVKQSNKKNSTDGRMSADWRQFAKDHKLGALPDGFYGQLIRWEKTTYEFGDEMSPGRAMIPLELLEEGSTKTSKKTSTKAKPAKPVDTEPEDSDDSDSDGDSGVPEELVTIIHKTVGEDGATKDMIRRAVTKTSVNRKLIAAFDGGLDAILTAMEDSLDEDEGAYTRVDI